jgi:hypothetical protein
MLFQEKIRSLKTELVKNLYNFIIKEFDDNFKTYIEIPINGIYNKMFWVVVSAVIVIHMIIACIVIMLYILYYITYIMIVIIAYTTFVMTLFYICYQNKWGINVLIWGVSQIKSWIKSKIDGTFDKELPCYLYNDFVSDTKVLEIFESDTLPISPVTLCLEVDDAIDSFEIIEWGDDDATTPQTFSNTCKTLYSAIKVGDKVC